MATDRKDGVARALGWFSLGLGVVQVVAPRQLNRAIGLDDAGKPVVVQRLVGVRELVAGAGIFREPRPSGWLWARVAGDAMDLALLGLGAARAARHPRRVALAGAAVAGVIVPDVLEAVKLSRGTGDGTVRKAVTINRPSDEVERAWAEHSEQVGGTATFKTAPGGRGTEIHVELENAPPTGGAKLQDELRRFKQRVETGDLVRSEGSPRGETLTQHLLQRAARPVESVGGGSQ